MENNIQTADAIRKVGFEGEVLHDTASLIRYENDTSLFELRPALAVKPKNTDDIKRLVTFVASHKIENPMLSLTPRAAGTGMAGGALNDSIIVDVGNMNHIRSVTTERVIVEPGVFYRDMDLATKEKGVIMPSFPASRNICAVGGMTGTNASGEMTLTYGAENKNIRVVLTTVYWTAYNKPKKRKTSARGRFIASTQRRHYDIIKNAAQRTHGYALECLGQALRSL